MALLGAEVTPLPMDLILWSMEREKYILDPV